ncbi:hypothetical protein MTR67_030636 [Solanum verrucosum]|uniref:Uncharacterized protein n=1 Tax=Solanum verrucosum TaxID=315347 RepID=A0AAF0TY89_SOLVR|nr:hypothetical protein MTR67_030636 [Solanum verrucosum]
MVSSIGCWLLLL